MWTSYLLWPSCLVIEDVYASELRTHTHTHIHTHSSGIYPPPNVVTKPYGLVSETLRTGDIVLFSGATSSGAIIKFFDHSQFSHCGVVSPTTNITLTCRTLY